MEDRTVSIPSISCGHCVKMITSEVGKIEGVALVVANEETKEAMFRWSAPASWEAISAKLKDIGFSPAD